MAERLPLVIGDAGYAEELQSGDSIYLPGGGAVSEYYADYGVFAATTGATFLQYFRYTTPPLSAGVYRVDWHVVYSFATNNGEGHLRVQVDDTIPVTNPKAIDGQTGILHVSGFRAHASADDHGVEDRIPSSGFSFVSLSAGAHDVDVDFAGVTGSFGLHYAALSIRRVA